MKSLTCLLVLVALTLALVSVCSAQAPSFTSAGVVNGASFLPSLSPGVVASVFGSNLSGTGLSVTLGGAICFVIFQSPGQLNVQFPVGASTGPSLLVISHSGGSASAMVTLNPYSPALFSQFAPPDFGVGLFTSGGKLISTTNKANEGDTLSGFGVGLGATSPALGTGVLTPPPPPLFPTVAQPTVSVGGLAGTLLFSGLTPFGMVPGAYRTDFIVPTGLASGSQPVTWTIGSSPSFISPSVTLPIACHDITAQVVVTPQQLKCKAKETPLCTQAVHIRSKTTTSTFPTTGGTLLLTGLSSNATLLNAPSSVCPPSDGVTPNTRILSFTPPGDTQTAKVDLDFADPTGTPVAYGWRVLVP